MAEENKKVRAPLDVLGQTGLDRASGYVYEEWLPQLSGTRANKVYREMRDNDAVVGAVLLAIESLIKEVTWRVSPSNDSEEAHQAALFLEQCMTDMSTTFEDFLDEALSMFVYGYSYFETVYKRRGGDNVDPRFRSRYDDGRVGWRKFSIRSQDSIVRWVFDEEGGIRGAIQQAPPTYQETFLPIEKCLLFRTTTSKNNPEGRSMLRNAYRSYYFLKRIQEIEAIGIERDLAGLPVLEVPEELMSSKANASQKSLRSSLEKLVSQIRRDEREGVVMPSSVTRDGNPTGYKLSLLSSGGRRQIDSDVVIKRYESRIAMTVLAEFILLGMDGVGSFALASSKTNLFAKSVKGILDDIQSTFNRYAVSNLFKYNPEFDENNWPTVEHGDIETPNLDEVANYVQKLTLSGLLTPDRALEEKLRAIADLPDLSNDDVSLEDLDVDTLEDDPAPSDFSEDEED